MRDTGLVICHREWGRHFRGGGANYSKSNLVGDILLHTKRGEVHILSSHILEKKLLKVYVYIHY